MSEYIRLEKGDDWGRIYYALPGERLNESGMSSFSLGIDISSIKEIAVRLPDGFEGTFPVVEALKSNVVSDHGHSYPVQNKLYGIELEVHGMKFWKDLCEIEVLKSAIENLR